MPFPKQNNWNHLTLTPFRQDKRQIKLPTSLAFTTSYNVFSPYTFARIISAFPEKFQNVLYLRGLQSPLPFVPPCAYIYGEELLLTP